MALRITDEQALKMGIASSLKRTRCSKRQNIIDHISEIRNANVSMDREGSGYKVVISNIAIPSWNTVLRWDIRREFPSYNKAWHLKILEAALESGFYRERRTDLFLIDIMVFRRRLLDYDNICLKQVIDGCVRSGLIADDSPKYIAGYNVKQVKAKENKTIILFKEQIAGGNH